jgi:hypothetical protein
MSGKRREGKIGPPDFETSILHLTSVLQFLVFESVAENIIGLCIFLLAITIIIFTVTAFFFWL